MKKSGNFIAARNALLVFAAILLLFGLMASLCRKPSSMAFLLVGAGAFVIARQRVKKPRIRIQHLLLIAFFAGVSNASATVLTFDISGATDGVAMPQGYGDRASSTTDGAFSYGAAGGFTPNAMVDYFSPDAPIDLNFWTTGYNDLVNVVENEPDGEASYTIRLTADTGFGVRLDSFDLGNFGGAVTLPGLSVVDGDGNVLFSMSNIPVGANSGPHQDYDFAGGLFAAELNIIVDTTGLGGNSDNIGLDNIQFEQDVIPEPSTYAMFMLGGALAWFLAARSRARRLTM